MKANKKKPSVEAALRAAIRRVWFYGQYEGAARKAALARAKIKGHAFYCCEVCQAVTRKPEVDHRTPVGKTPGVGFLACDNDAWENFMTRMFCPAIQLDVLCAACHRERTNLQRSSR